VHPASTFDDQAPRYDGRAGLPSAVGALVARSITERAGAGPDDLVVELGAGTGEIGSHLSRLPIQYVGLDASAPMLRLFRAKAADVMPSLILADADRAWPLRDGVAAVVVASRVVHLLDPEHAVRETLRIGRRAGFLMLGRVLRDGDSIKERLRRRRQELLLEAGVTPRHGAAGTRRVVALCQAAGAESLGRWVVAEWTGETTPAAIIAGWEALSRMGSVPIDPETRAGIVDELRTWARVEIGDLDRPEAFRERYAIDHVRLP
jgi:SAM-dependent methyltransferase